MLSRRGIFSASKICARSLATQIDPKAPNPIYLDVQATSPMMSEIKYYAVNLHYALTYLSVWLPFGCKGTEN
uniref:Uncharacterized protein n=1 Tax=Heterorhabditis bacteriophora TaxID=37862 RepID=A0A1I7WVM5_HETBA